MEDDVFAVQARVCSHSSAGRHILRRTGCGRLKHIETRWTEKLAFNTMLSPFSVLSRSIVALIRTKALISVTIRIWNLVVRPMIWTNRTQVLSAGCWHTDNLCVSHPATRNTHGELRDAWWRSET